MAATALMLPFELTQTCSGNEHDAAFLLKQYRHALRCSASQGKPRVLLLASFTFSNEDAEPDSGDLLSGENEDDTAPGVFVDGWVFLRIAFEKLPASPCFS